MFTVLWGKNLNQSSISNAQVKCAVGEEGRLSFRNAVAVLAIVFCLHSNNSAAVTDDNIPFKIPQQRADTALTLFAEQANLTLVFPFDQVKDITANRLVGNYPIDTAINILLQDTGLMPTFSNQLVLNIAIDDKGKSMNKNTRKTLLASMVGLFAAGGLSTAAAQETESARAQGVLDEIIITATKRETTLQDTASSIAAIGGEELSRRGISGMEDYLAKIPGVSFLDQGVGQNNFIIRGIASDPEGEALRTGPSVGLYFGEVPLAGLAVLGGGANLRLVDMERVEVLRGPQGTLFGAGSLSGAVRNIPNLPNLEEVEGSIGFGYSSTAKQGGDNHNLEGVINIPLIQDKLAIRAVVYQHDNSGYINNVRASDPTFGAILTGDGVATTDRGDVGATEYTGGRVSLLWQPNDDLNINLQYVTQEAEQDGFPEAQLNTGGYTQTRSPFGSFTFQSPLTGKTLTTADEEALEVDIDITNLVIDYDLGNATLISSTSWIDQESFMARDISLFFNRAVTQEITWEVDYLVQELRLVSDLDGKFQYIAGVYYEQLDNSSPRRAFFAGDPASNNFGDPVGTGDAILNDANLTASLDQTAFFLELSYDITDAMELTVGSRRYDYKRTSLFLSQGLFGTNLDDGGDDNDADETGSNHKVNLKYEISDDSIVYAQWAEGFRPGNTNVLPPADICDVDNNLILDGTDVPFSNSFDADTLESYEFGLKSTLLDKRLTVNATVYRNNWNDIPISVQSPTCGFSLVGNAATAQTQGFEIETVFSVTDSLLLSFGSSYVDAELTSDADNLGGKSGDRLPGSPDYSANAGVQYDFELTGYPAFIRADYAYISGFQNDLAGLSPEAGDYGTLDLKAGVQIEQFYIEAFGRNITNEDDLVWAGVFINDTSVNRLRPRTIGVNVGYQF